MRFPLEVVRGRARRLAGRPAAVRAGVRGRRLRARASRSRTPSPSPASSKARGVDASTSPAAASAAAGSTRSGYGYQVPFAARIRAEADIPTMAVGLIVDARQAEAIVADGAADLVALAREAQDDPNFAVHAARELTEGSYELYPVQAGPRLAGRAKLLGSLGPWTGPDPVQVRDRRLTRRTIGTRAAPTVLAVAA